jgi:hypothetical protein
MRDWGRLAVTTTLFFIVEAVAASAAGGPEISNAAGQTNWRNVTVKTATECTGADGKIYDTATGSEMGPFKSNDPAFDGQRISIGFTRTVNTVDHVGTETGIATLTQLHTNTVLFKGRHTLVFDDQASLGRGFLDAKVYTDGSPNGSHLLANFEARTQDPAFNMNFGTTSTVSDSSVETNQMTCS